MKKILLTLCLFYCILYPAVAQAATGEVEFRVGTFTEEELTNRNGKTLVSSRLAMISATKGEAWYMDTWESVWIGDNPYNYWDVVAIIEIWSPDSNYTDDSLIITRPVRTFNLFDLPEKKGIFV